MSESDLAPVGGPERGTVSLTDADRSAFHRMLDDRAVEVRFKPVVDLATSEVLGFHARAYGPAGTPFHDPAALRQAARDLDRAAALDWVCQAVAFQAFIDADLPPSVSLFLRVEPESRMAPCPPDLVGVISRAQSLLRVFVKVEARALAADPAGLLAVIERARTMGWGVVVDHVGADRNAVALLPVVMADAVAVDLDLLAGADPDDASIILTGVLRYQEVTGATLIATGVPDEAAASRSRALGARFGQGPHWGGPAPLPSTLPPPHTVVPLVAVGVEDLGARSPADLVADLPHRRMTSAQVTDLVWLVAFTPRLAGSRPIFLACTGRTGGVNPKIVERTDITSRAALGVIFGVGLPSEPLPGTRGLRLEADDPMAGCRFTVILSDQPPVALVATNVAGDPDLFDTVVTHDPDAVHAVARHVMRRIPPAGVDTPLPVAGTPLAPAAPHDDDAPSPEHATGPARTGWRSRYPRG